MLFVVAVVGPRHYYKFFVNHSFVVKEIIRRNINITVTIMSCD